MKEDPKKEEPKKKAEVPKVVPVADPILDLKDTFAQFLISSEDNQSRNRTVIQELRDAFLELKKPDYLSPTRDDLSDTPLLKRSRGGRRSSMFFGMSKPPNSPLGPTTDDKPNIQAVQADIVYEMELKVNNVLWKAFSTWPDNLNYFLPKILAARLRWLTWSPTTCDLMSQHRGTHHQNKWH